MRSSSGAHYVALDHVRALAAFMVFSWHFLHGREGQPIPYEGVPALFPLALLDEGHTGVALFMTLSGYLFAKLLDGKAIHYPSFIWNRFLRLFPLLAVVIIAAGVVNWLRGESLRAYAISVAAGIVLPSLPNGGWSITVEFHYYLILPLFLWLFRRSRWLPLIIVAAALAVRTGLYLHRGEIQSLAYFTIVGRVDQFCLGMMAFHLRGTGHRRHLVPLLVILGFMGFYQWFDAAGGYYAMPSYPSPSPLWVVLPTLEGLAYGIAVAWYDGAFVQAAGPLSRFVGRMGEYSYSIYLLHFFVVFDAARFVSTHLMNGPSYPVALAWAAVAFVLMMIPGYLSFRFVEAPFLRLRRRYVKQLQVAVDASEPATASP
jgi:peptidoglycan/LPS O-acetylase OafA/YrhL